MASTSISEPEKRGRAPINHLSVRPLPHPKSSTSLHSARLRPMLFMAANRSLVQRSPTLRNSLGSYELPTRNRSSSGGTARVDRSLLACAMGRLPIHNKLSQAGRDHVRNLLPFKRAH